jgi:murein DD-endopeptidase MepM/ murein hydrolase activator NlpD
MKETERVYNIIMRRLFFIPIFFLSFWAVSLASTPLAPTVTVSNSTITQGEPVLLSLTGIKGMGEIQSTEFLGKSFKFFMQDEKFYALLGVDLHQKPGVYKIIVNFTNGIVVEKNITVKEREKIKEPLGIPEKLGGDTKESQANLVSDLTKENATLENIKTAKVALWWENFELPLSKIYITSPYGYSRETGSYNIAHKGTDFRASLGTEVRAVNLGIVRLVEEGRTYGKTIVVDHGLGVQSFYLHLSEIKVKKGQIVKRGEVIGLSGQSGYATGPHLHLSLRINGSSVDPMKFFELTKGLSK